MSHQEAALNSQVSIQRIPPELLFEIFKALSPPCYLPRWPEDTSLEQPRTLSHVCSSWRTIALSLKSLWTSIPIVNEFWAGLSMERSRPLPISIIVTLDGSHLYEEESAKVPIYNLHDGLQMALSEPYRICALQAELATYRFGPTRTWLAHKLFVFLETAEVPQLEFLNVNLLFHDVHGTHSSFLGRLPPTNLRSLSLCGVYQGELHCPHLITTTLTTLDLGSGVIWDSIEDACVSLSRMPSLEVLAIRRNRDDMFMPGALPSTDILDTSIQPRSISLPNLKKLYLFETLELITCLMRSFAFPISATIDLHDASEQADEQPGPSVRDCLRILTTALNAHYARVVAEDRVFRGLFLFSGAEDGTVHRQRLQFAADYALRNKDSEEARACSMSGRIDRKYTFPQFVHDNCPLYIRLCNDDSTTALELVETLSALPVFRDARALVFLEHTLEPVPEPYSATGLLEWVNVMRYIRSVKVAHLGSYIAVHHLAALLEVEGYASSLATTDLVIEDVSFCPDLSSSEQALRPARFPFDRFMLALQRCNTPDTRKPGGAGHVVHVELIHCDIDEDQIAEMRREFGDEFVLWDGLVQGSGESRRHASLGLRRSWRRR